ncbi:MAG: hypothetical protein JJE19_07010 [Methanosarcinales archaeon]|nr:hypothetical protein [Methanosarcinales archaeon]
MSEEQVEKYQERMKKHYGVSEFSKDERAKELCGVRPHGQPLFLPHELGFACPVCGASDEVDLHFSEYKMFLWCKRCNLDIPSCLCVKYHEPNITHEELPINLKIEKATKIFLDCLEEKERKCEQKEEKSYE